MKRALSLLAAALVAFAGAPASSQTRGDDELQTLTILQVDPNAKEIVVRETGSRRNRTIELDDHTALFGGALGGRMTLQDLQPGDTIRVPGVAGSVSDRVRAEEIQILAMPRGPGDAVPPRRQAPDDRPERRPSAMDPSSGAPGALDRDRMDQPGALGTDRKSGPGALGTDPEAEPGRIGTDPGASDQETRGTGSPTDGGTRSGDRPPQGSGGSGTGGRNGSAGGGGSGGSSGGGP